MDSSIRLPGNDSFSDMSSLKVSVHKMLSLHMHNTHTHTHTASSDVQNELSGLGVSVYNQDEFEAGVLQQIDREVTKRNAEQQRRFLMKEYSSVKHEIR